ncbi:F(420)H(2) dehydrogenase subunit J [uncultured archaeon]|nr:F(420)H(2) dehydrogenase subunit J [uncultured archaeon]
MLNKIFNLIVVILLFAVLFVAIDDSFKVWAGKDEVNYIGVNAIAGPDKGGIFSDFIFPFEVLSLLLLAALIGALYIAKKEA